MYDACIFICTFKHIYHEDRVFRVCRVTVVINQFSLSGNKSTAVAAPSVLVSSSTSIFFVSGIIRLRTTVYICSQKMVCLNDILHDCHLEVVYIYVFNRQLVVLSRIIILWNIFLIIIIAGCILKSYTFKNILSFQ